MAGRGEVGVTEVEQECDFASKLTNKQSLKPSGEWDIERYNDV